MTAQADDAKILQAVSEVFGALSQGQQHTFYQTVFVLSHDGPSSNYNIAYLPLMVTWITAFQATLHNNYQAKYLVPRTAKNAAVIGKLFSATVQAAVPNAAQLLVAAHFIDSAPFQAKLLAEWGQTGRGTLTQGLSDGVLDLFTMMMAGARCTDLRFLMQGQIIVASFDDAPAVIKGQSDLFSRTLVSLATAVPHVQFAGLLRQFVKQTPKRQTYQTLYLLACLYFQDTTTTWTADQTITRISTFNNVTVAAVRAWYRQKSGLTEKIASAGELDPALHNATSDVMDIIKRTVPSQPTNNTSQTRLQDAPQTDTTNDQGTQPEVQTEFPQSVSVIANAVHFVEPPQITTFTPSAVPITNTHPSVFLPSTESESGQNEKKSKRPRSDSTVPHPSAPARSTQV